MEMWAKLFESNGRQVLISKDTDDEDNPKLSIAVRIQGDEIAFGPCFSGENAEEARDQLFDKANQEMADGFTQILIGCETPFEAAEALMNAA